MADFEAQVNAITNLGIDGSTTDPGRTELSQFLNDGVIDVTNKIVAFRPQDILNFQRESATIDSNSGLDVGGAKIISIIREAGTDGSSDGSTAWRECKKISAGLQSRVVDSESLYFASQYNPKYMIDDNGKVNVYPVASANNGYKVFFVNNIPTDETNEIALVYSHSDIKWFPNDKVYLVVLYAGIKSLQASLSAVNISTFSLTAVPPDVPSISAISFSESNALAISATSPTTIALTTVNYSTVSATATTNLSSLTAPAYTKPVQTTQVAFSGYTSGLSETDPGTTVVTAVPPDSITDTIATFTLSGEFDDAMAKAKALIDDAGNLSQGQDAEFWLNDEDPEMIASTVQVASQELQRANLGLQDALQTFNTDMQKFQASGTGKFSAEVAAYQAEVGAQVQEYTQKLQQYQVELNTAYQAWAKTESDNLQVFQLDVQNELNEFNKEQASFQYEVQKALADANATNQIAMQNGIQEAQDAIQNNSAQVARFQSMAQHYSVQVNEDIQAYTSQLQSDGQIMQGEISTEQNKLAKYQAEIAEYQAEIAAEVQAYQQEVAEKSTEYQWQTARLQDLKQEYAQAFAIMAPAPPPQAQQPQRRASR